jgi:putative ATP-dependent endonuclease of OLD family
MKIAEITIHNFRSIAHESLQVGDYSLLIGANNAGKSNCIDALQSFYETLKFEAARDLPKFAADHESWVEIEYRLNEDEAQTIRQEYLIGKDRFRVRKWLYPADKAKEGIYGYEHGTLSANLFYGWKNVSQGKLGDVVYIPATSKLEEHTKLSGPSALRDLLNDILKPIIKASPKFAELAQQFGEFGASIKKEETPDHRSVEGFEQKINKELARWGVTFGISIDGPKEEDIVKGLIHPSITDRVLKEPMDPSSYGHGFQRHLIFTIIRTAASYVAPSPVSKKKEFKPELNLILFEEPEAFLHPAQQEVLDASLRELAKDPARQVLIATHSPLFVSYNTDDIVDLIKVCKPATQSQFNQISRVELDKIFTANQELIREALGEGDAGADDVTLEELRHFLWLNPERCSLFFSDFVIVAEGLTEQVLITYLVKTNQLRVPECGIYVLDAVGKYDIPRFMSLLGAFNIDHVVLHDFDSTQKHEALNQLIQDSRNPHTLAIEVLDKNLEDVLGFKVLSRERWKKASALFLAVRTGKVDHDKLQAFTDRIQKLLSVERQNGTAVPAAAIVLVKANVCRLLEPKLVAAGFNVLNHGAMIPFPSTGHQTEFRTAIRTVLGL